MYVVILTSCERSTVIGLFDSHKLAEEFLEKNGYQEDLTFGREVRQWVKQRDGENIWASIDSVIEPHNIVLV